MNLESTSVCQLPPYPGSDDKGPVVLQYLEDQDNLVACGSVYEEAGKACHSMPSSVSSQSPSWSAMPSLLGSHCYYPASTRSHYLSSLGWFVFGQQSCFQGFASELFTEDQEWIETPTSSPYTTKATSDFPWDTCSVALNNTHIMVTGGFNGTAALNAAWILDLTDYTWIPAAPMPLARYDHGCTTKAEGGMLIAGGFDGDTSLEFVQSYDPATDTWSLEDLLPNAMDHFYPVLFHWNDTSILLEWGSDKVWMRTSDGWEAMEATIGSRFYGSVDTAVLVPASFSDCP